MSKGERKSNREIRKPKKTQPPKPNASAPSLKGNPASVPEKRS